MSTSGTLESFERSQKEAFGLLLRSLIHERDIQFIAEEARHGQESVTHGICGLENCRYANVEMTPEERTNRNIPAGYQAGGRALIH